MPAGRCASDGTTAELSEAAAVPCGASGSAGRGAAGARMAVSAAEPTAEVPEVSPHCGAPDWWDVSVGLQPQKRPNRTSRKRTAADPFPVLPGLVLKIPQTPDPLEGYPVGYEIPVPAAYTPVLYFGSDGDGFASRGPPATDGRAERPGHLSRGRSEHRRRMHG
jgi:hypothetical protein